MAWVGPAQQRFHPGDGTARNFYFWLVVQFQFVTCQCFTQIAGEFEAFYTVLIAFCGV